MVTNGLSHFCHLELKMRLKEETKRVVAKRRQIKSQTRAALHEENGDFFFI